MSNFQVRVLYDYFEEPSDSEPTVSVGEILTVIRTDVSDGWWEGTNSRGVTLFFPEAYVETITNSVVSTLNESNQGDDACDDDWDNDSFYSESPSTIQKHQYLYQSNLDLNQNSLRDGDTISTASQRRYSTGTVTKKSFNRFSTFVKSGGESYILGTLKVQVEESNLIRIIKHDERTYLWPPVTPSRQFTVVVDSPKRESKLKGLKSYIAYQLTPSFSNVQVSRRFKHFDWLHERMIEKFCLIAVPPLPDKKISGRYEEEFIEHRKVQLQEFVNWVCRHPVLSMSDVWQQFLTCKDEKSWKHFKRTAEKDDLIGANFCLCLDVPNTTLLTSTVDEQIDSSIHFINNFDAATKHLMATAADQSRKHVTTYKKEYTKIGESFYTLGTAIESADKATPTDLATGAKRIGSAYVKIGKIFVEQPKLDWEPLAEKLCIYKGITGAFPEMFTVHRGAQQKRKECEKINTLPAQLNDIQKRADTVSYAIFAELNHFKTEREIDLKITMKNFLKEQVKFYKTVVENLEDALNFFE